MLWPIGRGAAPAFGRGLFARSGRCLTGRLQGAPPHRDPEKRLGSISETPSALAFPRPLE